MTCDGRADAHDLTLSRAQVPCQRASLCPCSPSTFHWLPPRVGFCQPQEPPVCKRRPFVSLAGLGVSGVAGGGLGPRFPFLDSPTLGVCLCLQAKSRWT